MSVLSRLLRLSRPRFWLYTLGPFILPILAQFPGIASEWPMLLLGLLYFSFPANLLIYGINDLFDRETDALNPKKGSYEATLHPSDVRPLLFTIILTNLPFIVLLFVLSPRVIPALVCFLFFGIFYSAPPIRAKAIPFIDGLFNVLYVLPSLVSLLIFPYTQVNLLFVVAGTFWCMAMHAFSAAPDIHSDAATGLKTTATTLGSRGTLIYCALLWSLSAFLCLFAPNPLPLTVVIPLLCLYLSALAVSSYKDLLFDIYRIFPYINFFAGAYISLYLLGFIFPGPSI